MKKVFALLLVVVMAFGFTTVFAQETAEVITVSLDTVGNIFSWDNTFEEVEEFLAGVEGLEYEVEEDEDGGMIITAEVDLLEELNEYDVYCFYFDAETGELYELEALTTFGDEYDVSDVVQYLLQAYGLEEAEEYTDEAVEEYLADFEIGAAAAGEGTIVMIGVDNPTEEDNAIVALTFIDRAWYEAE